MAVQISGNDITVPRDGTFSRNVSIAGTLTYEDVTNVDSIGLVTARNGIEVGASPGVAASISVDGNAIFSGITTIATLRATTGIVTAFQGDVVIEDKIIHSGDTNTAIRFPAADTITAETAGSERLRVGSGGDVSVGGHATNYADSPLEVRGTNAGGDVAIRVTNNSTTAGTQAGVIFTTTTSDFTTAGIGYERGGTADALRFYVGQSDAAGGFDNATERLRITSDGNVLTSGNTQLFGSSTSDGSDNKAIMINGGGATSDSRGGYLIVHGNEHSSFPGITLSLIHI